MIQRVKESGEKLKNSKERMKGLVEILFFNFRHFSHF
jgi:hypothetical protein